MAIWNKPPQVDPATIASLQAKVDSDPMVQAFRAGYGSPNDPWTRVGGGRVKDPNQFSNYVKSILGSSLPPGYDVSQSGQIVYTNETPLLKQVAIASLPVTVPTALGAIFGGGGGAGAAGAAGAAESGATTAVPSMPWTIPAGFDASMGAAPAGFLAGAPALGSTEPGVMAGTTLGANGVSGLANGSSLLNSILTKYVPLGLAGLSAAKSFQTPSANQDLQDIIGTAKSRVQQSEPLFQALNRMAMGGLPNWTKNQ